MTYDESNQAESRRVFLFSGHMIDAPDRAQPRFSPVLEPAVGQAIRNSIDRLRPSGRDIAICSGACGGDIMFAEAVLDRSVTLRVYLALDETKFIEQSVAFADDRWLDRYRAVVARAECFNAPEALGPLPDGVDPFERTNLWMLDEARRIGGAHVSFICVWNGEGGDGPGGTQHMMNAVREMGGSIDWIDIRNL